MLIPVPSKMGYNKFRVVDFLDGKKNRYWEFQEIFTLFKVIRGNKNNILITTVEYLFNI